MDQELLFTDVHCHILPGIDDGPKNWETTLAMARLALAEGVRTIVATPHQLGRYESNTRQRILDLTAEARERMRHVGLPLTILPGADVRIQENLAQLVREREVLTLADRQRHVLIELPHEQVLPLGQVIQQLHRHGIDCILSHPERNEHLQQHPELVLPWVQQGCLVQVTAASITGHFGPAARELSRWLFREDMVHIVATDAHDAMHRPPQLRRAFKTVCRWTGSASAHKVFVENPQAVILGRAVDAPLPISSAQRNVASWWRRAFAS